MYFTSITKRFVIFFLATGLVRAQEKMGIVNSNYSSTNSIFLNPSSSADSRTYLQVKLFGANVYGTTNVGYQPGFTMKGMISGSLPPLEARNNQRNKFGIAAGAVEGPAFILTKNNFGAGIFVRARSTVNIRRLPYQITSLLLAIEPLSTDAFNIDVKNAGFNQMSWVEAGGNFSYIVRKRADNMMIVGANLRYLLGINVLYANMRSMTGVYTDTVIGITNIEGKLVQNEAGFFSGRGMGADLGFTYKRMLRHVDSYLAHSVRSNCRWIDYKFKIGITLRDLGYIKFRNATTKTLSGEGLLNLHRSSNDITVMPLIDVRMEQKEGPVRAMLPLTFSGQFDYNFENYFYVSGVFMKNLVPAVTTGVQGIDLFAIAPRFETKNVEVSLPVSFIRYVRPQLGFAFRIRTFVLGVDNVLPLVVRSNVSTFGVYFSVGFSIFRNHACKTRSGGVADCQPGVRIKGHKQPGLFKRIASRNKTYRK